MFILITQKWCEGDVSKLHQDNYQCSWFVMLDDKAEHNYIGMLGALSHTSALFHVSLFLPSACFFLLLFFFFGAAWLHVARREWLWGDAWSMKVAQTLGVQVEPGLSDVPALMGEERCQLQQKEEGWCVGIDWERRPYKVTRSLAKRCECGMSRNRRNGQRTSIVKLIAWLC